MKIFDRIIGWLTVVLKLLPLILQVVTTIEQSVPGAGLGAQKKQLVMSAVRDAIDQRRSEFPQVSTDAVDRLIDRMVDSSVTHLNAAGVFQHGASA